MQRNTILYSIIFLAQKDVKKDEHKIKHRWAERGEMTVLQDACTAWLALCCRGHPEDCGTFPVIPGL